MMVGTPKEPGTASRGKADYGLGWGSLWVYDSWVGRVGPQYAVTQDLYPLAATFRKADFSFQIQRRGGNCLGSNELQGCRRWTRSNMSNSSHVSFLSTRR